MLLVVALLGCGPAAPGRPSVLLVVYDTVRFDAVSANGGPPGITPALDALAAGGLRYTRAYSASNWTLPSQHRVSTMRRNSPDGLVMLAELLRDAGYDTVGFSENPWITPENNVTQGFQRFQVVGSWGVQSLDPAKAIAEWLPTRTPDRPFFAFVNLMEAHAPYQVRPTNPFLPAGVDGPAARDALGKPYANCTALDRRILDVQRGLYLGGVAADDRMLAAVLARLHEAGADRGLVTIVAADHGEHFGEHGYVHHNFGVYEPLVHVPLVVHGAPGAQRGVVDTPVSLTDVMPSVLGWAGLPVPPHVVGRPLPLAPGVAAPRELVAEYIDAESEEPDDPDVGKVMLAAARQHRRDCKPEDRADGSSRALVAWPLKLIRFDHHPPSLFDLSADPGELHDLAAARGDDVARLTAALGAQLPAVATPAVAAPTPGAAPMDPATLERLKALGYVGDGAPAD